MATIKAYTDLSQSKILSKILPLESADMNWHELPSIGYFVRAFPYKHDNGATEGICPCWSLATLLGVLPNENMLVKTTDGEYYCLAKDIMTKHYDNPVDACYEMILKLKEKELI